MRLDPEVWVMKQIASIKNTSALVIDLHYFHLEFQGIERYIWEIFDFHL